MLREAKTKKYFSCTSFRSHSISHSPRIEEEPPDEGYWRREVEKLIRKKSSLEWEALLELTESFSASKSDRTVFSNEIFDYNMLMDSLKSKNKACLCKPIEAIQNANHTESVHPNHEAKKSSHERYPDHKSAENSLKEHENLDEIIKQTIGKEIKIILCDGSCGLSKDSSISNHISNHSTPQDVKSMHNTQPKTCTCKCKNKKSFVSRCVKFCKKRKEKFRNSSDESYNCLCDKSAQTQTDRNNTKINTDKVPQNSMSTSCYCCLESNENTDRVRTKHSEAVCCKCGKIDPEKVTNHCPSCREQTDTLKLLIKMEAKQNFRQINSILQELAYQKEEVRRLNEMYEDMLKSSSSNASGIKTDLVEELKRSNCICTIGQNKDILKRLSCKPSNCPFRNEAKNTLKDDITCKANCCPNCQTMNKFNQQHYDSHQIPTNRGDSFLSLFRGDNVSKPENRATENNERSPNDRSNLEERYKCMISNYLKERFPALSEGTEKAARSCSSLVSKAKETCQFSNEKSIPRRIYEFFRSK